MGEDDREAVRRGKCSPLSKTGARGARFSKDRKVRPYTRSGISTYFTPGSVGSTTRVGEAGSAKRNSAIGPPIWPADVQQVAGVEADLEGLAVVVDLDLLDGLAGFHVAHGQGDAARLDGQLHRAALLGRDGGHAVDGLGEQVVVQRQRSWRCRAG